MLKLAPDSWTIYKTQQYFLTSQRAVKHARELQKQTGILSTTNKKSSRKICEEIITKVIEFYQFDKNSSMCHRKKEFVPVKVDGVKQHF